jgi:hypothetical protein
MQVIIQIYQEVLTLNLKNIVIELLCLIKFSKYAQR